MTGSEAVARGRAAFERQAWAEAYRELSLANQEISLEPADLDRFATAYLVGEESVSADARARAHASFVERGELIPAARSAFWLGYALISEPAQRAHANGWLARARRLLDECGADTVEHVGAHAD